MKKTRITVATLLALAGTVQAQDGSQINVICSVQAVWCNAIQTAYAQATGVKVNMSLKGSGEALAQLIAERANPKTDIWFGGTGDPHLQAAEQNLTLEYRSPALAQLHPWAQQQAEQSRFRTVGIYSGPLGFGYNPELLAKKKLPVPKSWADLLKPEYRGEIQVANPASSGTAYTMVATLVQLMGEEQAFDYLKKLHRNINDYTKSGAAPAQAAGKGETLVGVAFQHDVVMVALTGKRPLVTVSPCEGTGYEVGSMSLIKGGRNAADARKFYDWALGVSAQRIMPEFGSYQVPSNSDVAVPKEAPDLSAIKLINYDFAKYGSSAERRRLLARWTNEVKGAPR